ncbi:MAG: PD-(D/E)XK nuclease family protein [Anaerolineales bacterium]|nr:PD-(D/E)XK nuclease family protein [Anaerolineales bacterium]
MTIELRSLSQSSLQDYADCPYLFELRYLQHLDYPAVEAEPALENEKHQREGTYFHRLAQQYFLDVPVESISKLANSDNLERWWDHFQHSAEIAALHQMPLLKTETILSAPLPPFRLVAKYDLIASDGEKFFIYDWKTYRKRPQNSTLALRWQTRVYRALLAKAGDSLNGGKPIAPEQIEMIYWFADYPNDAVRFPYSADQCKRDWDALSALAVEIKSAASFPKTDNLSRCLFCAYRSHCNRGVRAGDALDAEIETEADESFDLNFEQIGEIEF